MENLQLLKIKTSYKNSKGESKTTYNYYLLLPNGEKVAIKNVFKNDYYKLSAVAKGIDND